MKEAGPVYNDTEEEQGAEFYRKLEIDTLARTIWGEARGEGSAGMQAVANVVMNRAAIGGWWGNNRHR